MRVLQQSLLMVWYTHILRAWLGKLIKHLKLQSRKLTHMIGYTLQTLTSKAHCPAGCDARRSGLVNGPPSWNWLWTVGSSSGCEKGMLKALPLWCMLINFNLHHILLHAIAHTSQSQSTTDCAYSSVPYRTYCLTSSMPHGR